MSYICICRWELCHDDRGRVYFHHGQQHRSQWNHPTVAASSASGRRLRPPSRPGHALARSPADADTASVADIGSSTTAITSFSSLPSAWEMRLTESGRVYFVNHDTRSTHWEDPRTTQGAALIGETVAQMASGGDPVEEEAEEDIVPAYARCDPAALLYTGLRCLLTPASILRNYASKVTAFRSALRHPTENSKWEIRVRRSSVLEDSYRAVMAAPAAQLTKPLFVRFVGEDALDYGGVSRGACLVVSQRRRSFVFCIAEWFSELSRAVFNPSYCLFEYSSLDNYSVQISPHSDIHLDHLSYYKFIGAILPLARALLTRLAGRVAGMAVFNQKHIEVFFVPSIYKRYAAICSLRSPLN